MSFTQFTDLSQYANDSDFTSLFSNTGLSGSTNLNSLSGEFSEIVKFVRFSLGEPILTAEIDNNQINVAFERASLEYSRLLSMVHMSNYFSTVLGLSRDFNDNDLKTVLPGETFNYVRRYSKNYGMFGPEPVGGNVDMRKGYVSLTGGIQDYNIYENLFDDETNLSLNNYLTSTSSSQKSIVITKLHYHQPLSLYRYFDPWNTFNVLSNEFKIESYAMNSSAFYIMPIWNDILRGQVNRQSDLVRKANFSYNQFGNRLLLFPTPKVDGLRVYFEYFQDPDAFNLQNDSASSGISSIWNIPMTDITYEEMNPMSRTWVREYTLALCREILGDIRSKYASVPVPNGDIQLNGSDLIQRGREDQSKLKEELRTDLEQFRKENIMEKEAKMAQSTNDQLKFFPLPIMSG